jgi:adenylosuccinate lyase
MTEAKRQAVERIDDLLQQLSAIDPKSLTEAEQEARTDVMASVYARAEYVLQHHEAREQQWEQTAPCTPR